MSRPFFCLGIRWSVVYLRWLRFCGWDQVSDGSQWEGICRIEGKRVKYNLVSQCLRIEDNNDYRF